MAWKRILSTAVRVGCRASAAVAVCGAGAVYAQGGRRKITDPSPEKPEFNGDWVSLESFLRVEDQPAVSHLAQ